MMDKKNLEKELEGRSIKDKIIFLAGKYPAKVIFTTSFGFEDQVITDIIFRNDIPVEVVTIDTGRLFEETYKVLRSTRERYAKSIKVYFPAGEKVEKLLAEKGPFSFYESVSNRRECCYIRKVLPLLRALRGHKIWITGLRADQSENRSTLKEVEWDEENNIVKFNPLLYWSLEQVKNHIKDNNVPYNALHDKGYGSIGCEPCTRALRDGETFRAGRWWWEHNSGKECGMHER